MDEAIRLLGTDVAARRYGPQNNVEFYTDLLARWLLAQDGRVEQANARLRRLPGKQAVTDLAELLIEQTHFAEAVAVIPDVAAQREEERRFWTDRTEQKEMAPSDSGDGWGDPWTAPNTAHLE